jgi:transglutaminase-like putative cysteine protease
MRLSIEHETHYRFDAPAHHSIQYLRLTPRADTCQSVIAWTLTATGKIKRWTDGFGNHAHVSVQNGVHDEVPVVVRGEVETVDTFGVLPSDDGLPPLMFSRPTRFTKVDGGIEELARPLIERKNDEGAIAALHALMWSLHNTVAYQAGLTDVETTAAEALAQGSGVCQDHAHLFIAGARVLGVPARYVSGYLFCEEDEDGHRASLASHAWAEAYVDDLGWVSFDTTNSRCATDAYVRLAIAFDYAGAAPIRGLRRGGGVEEMSVRLQVTQKQAQAQSQRSRSQPRDQSTLTR